MLITKLDMWASNFRWLLITHRGDVEFWKISGLPRSVYSIKIENILEVNAPNPAIEVSAPINWR